MSLKLNQFVYKEGGANGLVHPEEDALLYHHVLKANHMILPISVTSLGANMLLLSGGSGIIYGRMFIVEEEILSVPLSSEGELPGRTIIRIDVGDVDAPITWEHQAGNPLPSLRQDNFLDDGTVFEIPVASYLITDRELLDVNSIPFASESLMYKENFDPSCEVERAGGISSFAREAIRVSYDPDGRVAEAGGILEAIYPVGSVYMSFVNRTPGDIFGFGRWERIANGRVLVGVDENDDDFAQEGIIDGSKHLQEHSHIIPAMAAASNGAHIHSLRGHGSTLALGSGGWRFGGSGTILSSDLVQSSGAHTHSIPANNTECTGTGNAQNMPPYLTCHIWQRTA